MSWIDDEMYNQWNNEQKNQILENKILAAWKNLIAVIENDIKQINDKYIVDIGGEKIEVRKTEWNRLCIHKYAYPAHHIDVTLNNQSRTIEIERKKAKDERSRYETSLETLRLELNPQDEVIFKIDNSQLNQNEVSQLILRPLLQET